MKNRSNGEKSAVSFGERNHEKKLVSPLATGQRLQDLLDRDIMSSSAPAKSGVSVFSCLLGPKEADFLPVDLFFL